jgi:hypothetical protein
VTAVFYAAATASKLKTMDIQIQMRVDGESSDAYVWVGGDGVQEALSSTPNSKAGKNGIAAEITAFLESEAND